MLNIRGSHHFEKEMGELCEGISTDGYSTNLFLKPAKRTALCRGILDLCQFSSVLHHSRRNIVEIRDHLTTSLDWDFTMDALKLLFGY